MSEQALRVLLVEDSPDDARLIERHLRRELDVREARRVDRASALDAALDDGSWDLLLVDHTLPQFSGAAALEMVRARGLDLPAIVVSGTITDEMAGEIIRMGAADFLLKDRLARLGHAVRTALEAARLRREARAALAKLTASEQRLRDAEQMANLGHWVWEIAEDRVIGSDEQYRLVGLEPQSSQFGLEQILDFVLPCNRPALREIFERAAREGQPGATEARVACADGRVAVFDVRVSAERAPDGSIARLTGTCFDVTDRKAAEAAVVASEARYRRIVTTAQEGIWEIDAQGVTTFVNQRMAQMLGFSPDEILDRPLLAFLDAEQQARAAKDLQTLRGGGHVRTEVRYPRRDGSGVWAILAANPLFDPSGKYAGALAMVTDISDRRRDEEELRRSQAELQETNRRLEETLAELHAAQAQTIRQERLHALGEMASGIAHDFNNALAPILGYSELLLARPELWDDHERTRSYLTMILTGATDAANVIRRLREFYRPPDATEAFRPVDLTPLVEQVVALTQPRWRNQALLDGREIQMVTDVHASPTVMGDEAELREALTNLVFNAVDAMPEGGTITIRARLGEQDRGILEVSDMGTGMSEETRERCLEPFYSTKGEHGTGLGLPMVYGIVTRHGGHLAIESAPGQGTIVRLELPLAAASPAVSPPDQRPAPSHPLRVLVVDDEPSVRDVLTLYLRQDGHTVETATNGQEGLERFQAGRFDLVLTDRAMPGLIGDDLARAIKGVAPVTPVVLLTGFGDLMRAAGQTPAGVDRVVSKPVRMATLREVIRALAPAQTSDTP